MTAPRRYASTSLVIVSPDPAPASADTLPALASTTTAAATTAVRRGRARRRSRTEDRRRLGGVDADPVGGIDRRRHESRKRSRCRRSRWTPEPVSRSASQLPQDRCSRQWSWNWRSRRELPSAPAVPSVSASRVGVLGGQHDRDRAGDAEDVTALLRPARIGDRVGSARGRGAGVDARTRPDKGRAPCCRDRSPRRTCERDALEPSHRHRRRRGPRRAGDVHEQAAAGHGPRAYADHRSDALRDDLAPAADSRLVGERHPAVADRPGTDPRFFTDRALARATTTSSAESVASIRTVPFVVTVAAPAIYYALTVGVEEAHPRPPDDPRPLRAIAMSAATETIVSEPAAVTSMFPVGARLSPSRSSR